MAAHTDSRAAELLLMTLSVALIGLSVWSTLL
jgi:hypothetical protein